MTGPERETLSQALELQRMVLSSLDAFRTEIMTELRSRREEFQQQFDKMDTRLSAVEESTIAQLAEAGFLAKGEAASVLRSVSRREWVRILVTAAGVAGTVSMVVLGILDVFGARF